MGLASEFTAFAQSHKTQAEFGRIVHRHGPIQPISTVWIKSFYPSPWTCLPKTCFPRWLQAILLGHGAFSVPLSFLLARFASKPTPDQTEKFSFLPLLSGPSHCLQLSRTLFLDSVPGIVFWTFRTGPRPKNSANALAACITFDDKIKHWWQGPSRVRRSQSLV